MHPSLDSASPDPTLADKPNPAKADLRRSFLQQRRALAPDQRQSWSLAIQTHLQALPLFQHSKTVLAYFSIRQEPDLMDLYRIPKRWGFPVTVGQTLVWYPWHWGDPLDVGQYQIPSPRERSSPLTADQVDLILVPTLGMDQRGYRLGYGGGFYDRLFQDPHWRNCPTLGITFSMALVPSLPVDPWDHPLDGVCTELGCHIP